MAHRFSLLACAAALAACSPDASVAEAEGTDRGRPAVGCPPQVGSGLGVGQRVDIDAAMAFTTWRDDYPPRDCAGALAGLIPDLPEGYAVAPATLTTPPIMGDDHVAFKLAEPPNPRTTPDGMASAPTETLMFEIVRYTPEQIASFRSWFEANVDATIPVTLQGHEVRMASGAATMVPGRSTRIGTGLTTFLGDELVLKVSYTGMSPDLASGALERGETDAGALMVEIIERAEAQGLRP